MQRAEADRPDALPLVRQLQRFAQPSLLLQLGGRALRLRALFRLRRQVLHRFSQWKALQNPGRTPPLGVALPLVHAGRADPLVLPKLPAGVNVMPLAPCWRLAICRRLHRSTQVSPSWTQPEGIGAALNHW